MGELLTERLGLIKPNRDVNTPLDITRLNLNMDTLDRASGAANVADGVIPPTVELYDGKIVREKGTGRVWMAEKQSNGSFAKKWITWPYLGTFWTPGYPFPPNVWQTFGWNNFSPDTNRYCLNSSASDMNPGASSWVCPMKGVWELDMRFNFDAGSANQMFFVQSQITINETASEQLNSLNTVYVPPTASNITSHSVIQTVLVQGEYVLGRCIVNSPFLPYVTTSGIFKATMIHPIS